MNKNNNRVLYHASITLLLWFTVLTFLISPVLADSSGYLINGDFETGDFTGWTLFGTHNPTLVNLGGAWGNYTASCSGNQETTYAGLYQEFDNSMYDAIELDMVYNRVGGNAQFRIYDDDTVVYNLGPYVLYNGHIEVDLSEYNGQGKITMHAYYAGYARIDNVEMTEGSGYIPPSEDSFINFTPNVNITNIKPVLCEYNIHPDDLNYYYDNDTKRVGNTVEVMNWWTSNTSPELPSLWISEGFTDSNISGNHTLEYCDSYNSIYDIELRASWYELEGGSWLWHHGIDGILLANDTILWDLNYTYPDPDPEPDPDPYDPPDPYEPPEIPPPPMPNDWNMTIPEKYQNVSWLTNYTTYFSEVGGTVNTTLYSVTGWVISPLMCLNNTVYSMRYYISSTHDMVDGLSHLHMIVNYGWAVIPIEIKTIFTGTAAIGVCIYLFKRRT